MTAPTSAPAPVDVLRLELGPQERADVRALAEELTAAPPGLLDDPDWLAEARRIACRLPVRLAEALRALRHDPGESGILSIAGLPVDLDTLPDTPTVRDSVQRVAAVPSAVAMLLGQHLGEVVAYRNEKHGALVQDVVPVRSLAASQSNAGSVSLELHTENAFHPCRPDLVGLLCLRADRDGGAGTLVSSVRRALPLLDEEALAVLGSPRFVTEAPPSFGAGGATMPHPVLGGSAHDPDLRVDFNATIALDDTARAALDRLCEGLTKVSAPLVLVPGELVFLDNRLVAHGRTDFTPRYDGRDRWLHRVYVHLDARRGAAHRTGRRPVLV
ncbi:MULTISPECIES: TauD/TfdA family dioxygenase [unclassified Streptomyces]|uniref:TauD/TfdA family dioxygenase n=1 Tax=unclassified Streptomyces TaxID=2593676 RepID=UPI002E2BF37A|nr:TauD/TfdA family dioxygenase [Streptomyces sp. NBC_00223]